METVSPARTRRFQRTSKPRETERTVRQLAGLDNESEAPSPKDKKKAKKTKKAKDAPKAEATTNKKAKKARAPLFSIGKTVKPEVVMAFSRQLSSFLEAGISVLDALETVGEETASGPMKGVIGDIRASILRGTSFVDAVGAHPTVFPMFYRSMLQSAEYTGDLDTVLAQLAAYLERDIAAKRQVKSAMTYPTIVFVIAVVAMIVMSVFVLPKFTGLYRTLGAKLPLPTKMLLGFSDFMSADWPFLVGGILFLLLLKKLLLGGERNKVRHDKLALKLPVIGKVFELISLERFCRVLAALATAGVPLPDAIGVSADSTNNSVFQAKMVEVRNTIVRGSGVYEPMAASGLFPLAARQMIQVGERTGSLGNQLGKAAAFYEREVNHSIKKATDMFEPMMILFVGFIVGFVAVAQVAAMYSIFGQVK